VCTLVAASGRDGIQHRPSLKPERPLYLPSYADAADLRIYRGQFLAQISGFPQFLNTRQLLLLSQVRIDRVQPFVEVV